jgi:hypothetical protein
MLVAPTISLTVDTVGKKIFLNGEIGHRCRLKSAESLLTTFLLSDRKADWALDWDSEDEESLEVQRERVLLFTMGGVCLEALLALLWAVCNCAFPPSGDVDVWLRCLWLFGIPVDVARFVLSEMGECVALEVRKEFTRHSS